MRCVLWKNLSEDERARTLRRAPLVEADDLRARVAAIIDEVRRTGDAALRACTWRFDGVAVDDLAVPIAVSAAALAALPERTHAALTRAAANIAAFHRLQQRARVELAVQPGVWLAREVRAIDPVGLYVPGGSAPLPSTVLMLGIPAGLAGCREIFLCTPPGPDGQVDATVLAAARIAGITRIFRVGGAQAIAAMAYGTATMPRAAKIFGPGNAWVTEAKQQVARDAAGAAIDLPAGPSEVMVVADATADPGFVAIDLLSQAEHGPDSQAMLVALSPEIARRTRAALATLIERLPRREIARQALERSAMIVASDPTEALAVVNAYAPEHLILQVRDADEWTPRVLHAGSIFLGPWTPEAVGDYASGTNHVLPTYGYARVMGGLTLEAFQKTITVQRLTPEGLRDLGPHVEELARVEGLEAHRLAVRMRLEALAERVP